MRKALIKAIKQGNIKKFYKSTEWKRKRKAILQRDNFECQRCKSKGKYHRAETVHHIKHLKDFPELALIFAEETIVFDDNPVMRWYTNNVYQEVDKKGNTAYYKIEPKTRKTDGFFALVHALTKDGELEEAQDDVMTFDVVTF